MKTVTSFLIIGLLLLTQSLDADERGGGVGFALPTQHSSSPAIATANRAGGPEQSCSDISANGSKH